MVLEALWDYLRGINMKKNDDRKEIKYYSDEELELLHRLTLDMAVHFVEFCNEHKLLCYFCGGGCIGTIRHKGWIPWDDDLDFFMPREDYENLKLLWSNEQNERYKISFSGEKMNDRNIFVTIRDSMTTYVKDYQEDLDIVHGIVLDIFPLDGYPKVNISRRFQMIFSMIATLFCSGIVPENHGRFMKFGAKFALRIVPKCFHYKVWKFAERKMSKYKIKDSEYITELCAGPRYMKKKYNKEWFDSAVYMDFEKVRMPIPIGYHGYLTTAFGDYMELPPIEKRMSEHPFVTIDLNRSYKVYLKENKYEKKHKNK